MKKWWIALTTMLLGLCGCAAPLQSIKPQPGQSVDCQMAAYRFNGVARTYRLHIPAGFTRDQPRPLVVVVHGAFSTAREMERISAFSRLADREGFFVLYPNGIGLFGYLQHWNAGHCCGKAAADEVDDIGFIEAAIDDVAGQYPVDAARVYLVGFSNGGMLTHRIGAERSQRFAAIVPMAAAMGGRAAADAPYWQIPAPQKPLPVIIFHGRKDTKVPYDGGPVGGKAGKREYASVLEAVDFWRRHNGCRDDADRQVYFDGALEITTWTDCAQGAEVQLHSFAELGHYWPTLGKDGDRPSYDAATTIWEFMKRFTNP